MGFLSDFAYGFATTGANTILEDKKRQDAIDDDRAKKLAEVDPAADLYKRQKDIELDYDKRKSQQDNQNFLDLMTRMNGGASGTSAGDTSSQTQATPNVTAPAPTLTASNAGTSTPAPTGNPDTDWLTQLSPDSTNGPTVQPTAPAGLMKPIAAPDNTQTPSMAPAVPTQSTAPSDPLTDTHNKLQSAISNKAIAAGAGNKQLENYYDTQIDLYKQQYTYLTDTAKKGGAPVTSSEGTNIVDQIQKDNDAKLKDPTKYQSDYLPPKVNGLLAQPDILQTQQDSAVKHAALAQSISNVLKRTNPAMSTPEVYPLIREQTKKIITNVNVINSDDPRVTDDDKKTAVTDIEKYVDSLTQKNPQTLELLKKDPNYAAVFDDKTKANVMKIVGQDTATTTAAPTTKQQPIQSDNIPAVSSDADYAKILPGQQYRDPDGNIRTKGGK